MTSFASRGIHFTHNFGLDLNEYNLRISGITSFYYHDSGSYFNDDVASTEEWEYAELSEVVYDENKLFKVYVEPKERIISKKESFIPNIVMEIELQISY